MRAAPGVPLVYQPLCWRPSVCDSNHCGTMSRWSHVNLRSGLLPSIFGWAGRLSRPSISRRTSWVPRTSSQTPREPCGARVDATLPANKLVQRLGNRLVDRRVAHHAGPLAAGPLVGLGRVGRAPNNRGERVFPVRVFQQRNRRGPQYDDNPEVCRT
jgi:hypothetical protein